MKASIRIGDLLGVDAHPHLTFLPLIALTGLTRRHATLDRPATSQRRPFNVALFDCGVPQDTIHPGRDRSPGARCRMEKPKA